MKKSRARKTDNILWWKDAVIYQIYTRSFRDSNGDGIGDLRGIIDSLDYLEDLGVDALWLTPIHPSPDRDFGYDIEDYYSIHPQYGTLEDFDRLVESLHRRGMRYIMDLVVNHTSDRHRWFRSSETDPQGPCGDYYIWKPGRNGGPPNNWSSFFGGPAWRYSPLREEYYLHLFSENQADLNWENPEVRAEVYRIMRWWKERGVDGFRMDVINMISKHPDFPDDVRDIVPPAVRGTRYFINGPQLHEYLAEMRLEALEEPYVFSVGECPGAGLEEVRHLSGYERRELDTVMAMDLMEIDHGAGGKWDITPWSAAEFAGKLEKWQRGLENQGWPSHFFGNHDQPRPVSRFGNDSEFRYESATMLAAVLLSLSGTIFIYYGEAIGMPNAAYPEIISYRDVDTINFYEFEKAQGRAHEEIMKKIRYMSRDNARSPMQWSGEKPHAGFSTAQPWIPVSQRYPAIHVEAEEKAEKEQRPSILGFYKRALLLRKEHSALRRGAFRLVETSCEECIAFRKTVEGETVFVLSNFSPKKLEPKLKSKEGEEADALLQKGGLLLGNYRRENNSADIGKDKIVLRPYEARIYRL
ncbi:MAG: alpha-glucosidase [Sediminispirochaetaceae bacterium]